jgi:acyl-CoA thioesterase II
MNGAGSHEQSFDELFSLTADGEDAFVARFPFAWGGTTLACGARVACLSAPDKALRSLHAWFLRPVASNAPVRVTVERLRDGRALSHRRVVFEAEGKRLFELTASFAGDGAGDPTVAWQESRPDPALPAPAGLQNESERRERRGQPVNDEPISWRVIGTPYDVGPGGRDSAWDAWARPCRPMPDGCGWDAAALAYLSDNHSDWSMAQRVKDYTIRRYSTLDTAIWFHQPPRWDDWMLIRSVSEVAHGGFGLCRRALYRRDGTLVATMAQEALYR